MAVFHYTRYRILHNVALSALPEPEPEPELKGLILSGYDFS